MKAYTVGSYAGVDGLVLSEIADPPALAPGQVRVKMHAASINFRDLLMLKGAYSHWAKPGFSLTSDGAGEVVAVGEGVWRVKPGDRVALTFHRDWIGGVQPQSPAFLGRGGSIQGCLQQFSTVSQDEMVLLPPHLSYEEGATLPCAGVTAWSALCAHAVLLPGQTVLVQGSGGVSVFALQLARLFGARVIATSSSDEKLATLAKLGADTLINYTKTPDWHQAVLAATQGAGVDVAVEVGGADTFPKTIEATAQGGRISLVGLLTGLAQMSGSVFMRGLTLNTIRVGSREHFEQMNRAIAVNKLKPVIDRVFEFGQAQEALRYFEAQKHIGKVVIRVE